MTDINLSPQQEIAFKSVREWLGEKDKPIFRLFGFAGTGKTTIAKLLVESVKGLICYASFTGKAALVMQRNGMPAQTLHSLIYDFFPPEVGSDEPSFTLNLMSALKRAKLLVVDECSMVYPELARDVESFKVPILVLGDPYQLPPVSGTGVWTEVTPDIMLTEVHRQALDSPVLRLATDVRNGNKLYHGSFGSSRIIKPNELVEEDVLGCDQIIAGMNKNRRAMNLRYRDMKGYSSMYPENTERLICLRNNRQKGLLNGLQGIVEEPPEDHGPHLLIKFKSEDSPISQKFLIHKAHFDEYTTPGLFRQMPWRERQWAEEFDFGYVITGHKAQGSQWDNVLIYDDGFGLGNGNLHDRWLYTTITRAVDRMTMIKR